MTRFLNTPAGILIAMGIFAFLFAASIGLAIALSPKTLRAEPAREWQVGPGELDYIDLDIRTRCYRWTGAGSISCVVHP